MLTTIRGLWLFIAFVNVVKCKNLILKSNNVTIVNTVGSQTCGARATLNPQEEQFFIDTHNDYRRQQDSSNMELMYWNNDLSDMAQEWANRCVFEHGQPSRPSPPFNPIGQNIYADTTPTVPEVLNGAMQTFYNEVADYDYDSNTCAQDKVCGHYTQVVWATSWALGCAYAFCENLEEAFPNAYFVVCNYGPAGNWVGDWPFLKGSPCSECPDGMGCNQQLCDRSYANKRNQTSQCRTPKAKRLRRIHLRR